MNPVHRENWSHEPETLESAKSSSSESKESEEEVQIVAKRSRRVAAKDKIAKKAASEAAKEPQWEYYDDSVLVTSGDDVKGRRKICAFDMDSTLIVTASGRKFGVSRTDWKWFDESVPRKLRELYNDGYKVVIFSNQAGIAGKSYNKSKADMLTGKVNDIIAALGIPVQAYLATKNDHYRKPGTQMWALLVNEFNDGVEVDMDECYYVGDAAGRISGWRPGAKHDFSCSDRKFAHNAGLGFHTPESFFQGLAEADFAWRGFNPNTLSSSGSICDGGVDSLTSASQELVIFVGFPGSGKSTLAKKYMVSKGYVWVNRDTLKTAAKCIKATREALADGKSVVVDNTSPAVKTRNDYIKHAEALGVPVRCFRFTASRALAEHLNMIRERFTLGKHRHVPSIAYNMYNKKLEEPTLAEGFAEVKSINFVLDTSDKKFVKMAKQFT